MGSTILVAAAAILLSAGAQDASADWKRNVTMNEDKPTASSIHPEETDKPGVMLQCAGNTMSAVFAVEPIDFTTLEDAQTSRSRRWTGKLYIDEEMVDEREWIYLPALKAVWPGSKLVAAKVFNAIIRGQKVEFEVGRRDRVQVYLPSPDEAFAAFAQDCQSYKQDT